MWFFCYRLIDIDNFKLMMDLCYIIYIIDSELIDGKRFKSGSIAKYCNPLSMILSVLKLFMIKFSEAFFQDSTDKNLNDFFGVYFKNRKLSGKKSSTLKKNPKIKKSESANVCIFIITGLEKPKKYSNQTDGQRESKVNERNR